MKKPAKKSTTRKSKTKKKKYELGSIQLKDAGGAPKSAPRNFFWAY